MVQTSDARAVGRQQASDQIKSNTHVRAENARLRELLAQAEETASRHAILLREGDHRIKNSLQLVLSLVLLQARREESASAREALRAAAARIRSIAFIHDALQIGEGHDSVDLGVVLITMCRSLQVIAGDPRHITVSVVVESVPAPVALAQPIALAVNELVANALRHAYPEDHAGTIQVRASVAAGELRIVVADDGRGLPADCPGGRGYGMKLVRTMVDQIGGQLDVVSCAGAQFTITAPAPRAARAEKPKE
jgi:two-component sensor histidine kinase